MATFLSQADAQGAAESATAQLTPLLAAAFAGSPPEAVVAWQRRRTELTERVSGLQRWSVALALEAARQTAAAKSLGILEEQVGLSCSCRLLREQNH